MLSVARRAAYAGWRLRIPRSGRYFCTENSTLPPVLTENLVEDGEEALQRRSAPRPYVRITGCTYYAGRDDLINLLKRANVDVSRLDDPHGAERLIKVETDEVSNISSWVYKAADVKQAQEVARGVHGKYCGLKPVRGYVVQSFLPTRDSRIDLSAALNPKREKSPRDHKLNVEFHTGYNVWLSIVSQLKPRPVEYDRAILVCQIDENKSTNNIWYAFSAFNTRRVLHVPRLRAATVIFNNAEEAERALREKSNSRNLGELCTYSHVMRL